MNVENTMLIMKQFEEIQNEMKIIGEIDWIMNLEDNTCLASFYQNCFEKTPPSI